MTYTELSSESEGPFVLVHQEGLRQYRLEICRIARKRDGGSGLMMPVRTYLSSSQA
ncbi:hypothetical protein [Kosakonia radicincitans]|uniref:hypothetical protein n=1 Tax=Kosakonia radicincitans TaxID=283686 RepID=UPI0013792AFF|nr:hypothetical protein [Kosakonia radicincitans]